MKAIPPPHNIPTLTLAPAHPLGNTSGRAVIAYAVGPARALGTPLAPPTPHPGMN